MQTRGVLLLAIASSIAGHKNHSHASNATYNCITQKNTDFIGYDLFHFQANKSQCMNACEDSKTCTAFTLADGVCFLKSRVNAVEKANYTSFLCQYD
ncbi:unnamed protein product [Aphanomyces euteiches]|uniref:Apple domain-containing protein n=1 Tax=Aphanomyces euteiches TaxID=100861 RepID=A0A6G0WU21_9STRA|nr:hypothetical protein Ae201684_011569 [Aphanomyces euteiches]KAH9096925.1 hypothetical protein Ae201684P_011659 [Aphanomyces euteiches]KAH9101229.1 hypothetical protein LEN26_015825 [Aphanomyces euteiches]KAH9107577.1 hypothetical protein AeMF1_017121 [Aphanomyces euteiches]KAH9143543.1 hypothetical protein AeRB84_012461 [Aphanomyces euteiches]